MKIVFHICILLLLIFLTTAKASEIDSNVIQNYSKIFNKEILTLTDIDFYQKFFCYKKNVSLNKLTNIF